MKETVSLKEIVNDDAGGMICDLETGICGPADAAAPADGGLQKVRLFQPAKKVTLYYVTDPVCSHCWALEPVFRRFTDEYAPHLEVTTVMGGMLPAWDGFADRANGIGGPTDVAGHWREVGTATRMPIDGSVWLRDPLSSSYPPSRVYLVLKERSKELADRFLRNAREALFAFDRNISDPAVLTELVNALGESGAEVVAEASSERGEKLLEADIALARELGVRGFPTLLLVDDEGRGVKLSGARRLEEYATALGQALETEPRKEALLALPELLERDGLLFAREIEEYFDVEPAELSAFVQRELPADSYRLGEVLGESYFTNK